MAWNTELIVQYESVADMITAATVVGASAVQNGTIGLVADELSNTYRYNRNTGKWVVCSFNRYTTEQIATIGQFEVPIYTHIINTTTGDIIIEDGV